MPLSVPTSGSSLLSYSANAYNGLKSLLCCKSFYLYEREEIGLQCRVKEAKETAGNFQKNEHFALYK